MAEVCSPGSQILFTYQTVETRGSWLWNSTAVMLGPVLERGHC